VGKLAAAHARRAAGLTVGPKVPQEDFDLGRCYEACTMDAGTRAVSRVDRSSHAGKDVARAYFVEIRRTVPW